MEASRMPFGDHLEELRACLIRALYWLAAGVVVSLVFAKHIVAILCRPLLEQQAAYGLPPELQALSPQAGFMVYLKIGLLSGLILAMPLILREMWRFVASGLYPREQQAVRRHLLPSMVLFASGALFLYCLVLPVVLGYFISFNQSFAGLVPALAPLPERDDAPPTDMLTHLQVPIVQRDPARPEVGQVWFNQATNRLMLKSPDGVRSVRLDAVTTGSVIHSQFAIDFYTSFVLTLMLAFGISFELPVAVWLVTRIGIVRASELAASRKYVLLVLLIIAAVLTPPDVISQVMLAAPMYVLFEIGLLFARRAERELPVNGDE